MLGLIFCPQSHAESYSALRDSPLSKYGWIYLIWAIAVNNPRFFKAIRDEIHWVMLF
jgi:hypothetical protein